MADVFSAPAQRPRHIPSLDGLRALAIFLVMAVHTLLRHALYKNIPFSYRLIGNGALGVYIFFVLSGYLITTLLLREREATSSISLKRFYVRRAFRILPPLYAYIVFLAVLGAAGHLPGINLREVVTALTLTRNYVPHVALWSMEHLWSLCIEEQFYLLWPPVLVFCTLHRRGSEGRRAATWIALCVIVVEPFVRVLSFPYLPNFHNLGMFHLQADGLMFGVLGALQQGHRRFEQIYARVTRWPWMLPIVLFLVLGTLTVTLGNYWILTVGMTLNGFVILMWMVWLVRNPETILGRAMNQRAVGWIGRISYSLYLWQTFFLHPRNTEVFGNHRLWTTFPMSWLAILAVATLSHYLIERPSLQLRDLCVRRMYEQRVKNRQVAS